MRRGPVCVLMCYILWGLLPGYWRLMSALPPAYLLAARIVCSLAFIAALLVLTGKAEELGRTFRDRREMGRLASAGFFICINWGLFIWAVNSGHVLDSSLAYYMNPILSVLLGTVVFHERLRPVQWAAVGLTAAGIAIALIRFGRFPWVSLAIGGSFALYGAVKKGCRVSAGTSLFMETLVLSPFALAYILWAELRGAGAIGHTGAGGWLLLASTGIATSVPLLFFARGVRETPYTLTGILMYVNPTLQFITGLLFFGEKLTATYALLFGFVWTGLIVYMAGDALSRRAKTRQLEGKE